MIQVKLYNSMKLEIWTLIIGILIGAPSGFFFRYAWQEYFRKQGKKADLNSTSKSEIFSLAYDAFENMKGDGTLFYMHVISPRDDKKFYSVYGRSLEEINVLTSKIEKSVNLDPDYRSTARMFANNLLNILVNSMEAWEMHMATMSDYGEKLRAVDQYYEILKKDLEVLRTKSKM